MMYGGKKHCQIVMGDMDMEVKREEVKQNFILHMDEQEIAETKK